MSGPGVFNLAAFARNPEPRVVDCAEIRSAGYIRPVSILNTAAVRVALGEAAL
jgi:hypothetical protein